MTGTTEAITALGGGANGVKLVGFGVLVQVPSLGSAPWKLSN